MQRFISWIQPFHSSHTTQWQISYFSLTYFTEKAINSKQLITLRCTEGTLIYTNMVHWSSSVSSVYISFLKNSTGATLGPLKCMHSVHSSVHPVYTLIDTSIGSGQIPWIGNGHTCFKSGGGCLLPHSTSRVHNNESSNRRVHTNRQTEGCYKMYYTPVLLNYTINNIIYAHKIQSSLMILILWPILLMM